MSTAVQEPFAPVWTGCRTVLPSSSSRELPGARMAVTVHPFPGGSVGHCTPAATAFTDSALDDGSGLGGAGPRAAYAAQEKTEIDGQGAFGGQLQKPSPGSTSPFQGGQHPPCAQLSPLASSPCDNNNDRPGSSPGARLGRKLSSSSAVSGERTTVRTTARRLSCPKGKNKERWQAALLERYYAINDKPDR